MIVPKQPAPGNPWSWRGQYWDHEPQAEVELLRRGFHVAFVTPDPGKQWDAWYAYLTEKHGLSKKPAFVGMSKGGVNAYDWAAAHPDKVSCIYADNPAIRPDAFAKLGDLARNDVSLLNVCGSQDFLLERHTLAIEARYHQLGGRITVMIKDGPAHHPHSLRDPKPIADWIVEHARPSGDRPDFADATFAKSYYYSLGSTYTYLEKEKTYATCRGPGFAECYDRYDARTDSQWGLAGMAVIVPKAAAPGKPWVFRADPIGRDAAVDQALLAKGFHIVVAPLVAQAGPVRQQWDAIYKRLVDHGFSRKPVMEGAGTAAGEAYAWAIENPDKVSCIYGENPALRSLMSKEPPLDHLDALAKAGVPLIHACGSLDPWLDGQTRVAEKRYKELGGRMTVIVDEGRGHYPTAPRDPKPVVEFILAQQKEAPSQASAKPRDYRFDGTISREVLENYLSRAISMEGLLNGRGDLDDNIRMLKEHRRQVHRAEPSASGAARPNLLRNLERAREQIPKVHAADPEMILQACIFEIVTTQVEQVPVPEWAFVALGRPVEKRNFRYADMLYPDGRRKDHWRARPVGPGREPAGDQALVLLPGGVVHRPGHRGDPLRPDGADERQRPRPRPLFRGARADPRLRGQARPPAHAAVRLPRPERRPGARRAAAHGLPLVPAADQGGPRQAAGGDPGGGLLRRHLRPEQGRDDAQRLVVRAPALPGRDRQLGGQQAPGAGEAGRHLGLGLRRDHLVRAPERAVSRRLAALRLGLGAEDRPGRPSPDARQPHDAIAAGRQAMVLRQPPEPGGPGRARRRGRDPRHLGGRPGELGVMPTRPVARRESEITLQEPTRSGSPGGSTRPPGRRRRRSEEYRRDKRH